MAFDTQPGQRKDRNLIGNEVSVRNIVFEQFVQTTYRSSGRFRLQNLVDDIALDQHSQHLLVSQELSCTCRSSD